MYNRARVYVVLYLAVIALSLRAHSVLPIMFIGLTNLFGSWLLVVYGLTQHAGLAENVLDHRLNCRTAMMNPVHRFLYWNMNYHVEHHMFPLVQYHALPKLHEVVRDDCPPVYPSLLAAWREIMPAVAGRLENRRSTSSAGYPRALCVEQQKTQPLLSGRTPTAGYQQARLISWAEQT